MGGGLQKGCKCRCPGEDKYGELDPYVNSYPGPTSYVTRHEYDGGTGASGQYAGQQPGVQSGGMMAPPQRKGYLGCTEGWCCPEVVGGEVVGPLPAGQPLTFAVAEKSNLDFLEKDNQQQGYQDYQQPVLPYPPGQGGQIVNQQPVTADQKGSGRERTNDSQTGSVSSGRSGGRTASEWASDQEQFAHLPPLPAGWLRVLSRSTNKLYYCYPETGETTFTEPTGPPASKEPQNSNFPPGWTQMVSRSTGRAYYWHAGLQKSQFDFPTAADSVGVPPSPQLSSNRSMTDTTLPEGWVQMVSRSTGKTYYFNTATQESQFEHP